MDRFKVLDLADRVSEQLWIEVWNYGSMEVHNTIQDTVTKTIPKKKKCRKAKWLSEEAIQWLRKEEKWKANEKEKDTPK